jgi:gliding motility-associated-like protein
MPTGFMPKDGIYAPVSNCFLDFRMQILNRWGQVLYSGMEGWDGLFRGDEVPTGIYSYVLTYQYLMDGSNQFEEIQGVFKLIR